MRIRLSLTVSAAAVAFMALAVPATSLAAVDAFLQIDGVAGESTAAGHGGWIEVSSYAFGASRGIGSASSGAGAGKVSVHDIHITKTVDRASPMLRQAAASGQRFPRVVLEMRKAGGDPRAYTTYVLENVLISGFSMSSGGDRPQESLTLNFTRMQTKPAAATGWVDTGLPLPPQPNPR